MNIVRFRREHVRGAVRRLLVVRLKKRKENQVSALRLFAALLSSVFSAVGHTYIRIRYCCIYAVYHIIYLRILPYNMIPQLLYPSQ